MKNLLKFDINQLDERKELIDDIICAKLIKKLWLSFIETKKIQPEIKELIFGMGSYSLKGFIKYKCYCIDNQEIVKWQELVDSNCNQLLEITRDDLFKNNEEHDGNVTWKNYVNEGVFNLINYSKEIQSRLFTTYFDGITEKGVYFNVDNKDDAIKNPFELPSEIYYKEFYQLLKSVGVPVYFKELKK